MTAPRWRRHRSTFLVLGVLLLSVTTVVLLGSRGAPTGTALDPDNPGPDGARALARVLADQGVRVDVARGRDELASTELSPTGTVLVTSADELGPSTTRDVVERAGDRAVVVVDPPLALLEELEVDPPKDTASPTRPIAGRCADARFARLRVAADRTQLFGGEGCFRTEDGALLATPRPGLWLVGTDALLTNEQVVRADNAAAALRLLGTGDQLVWYVADATDLLGEEASGLGGVLPAWLGPGLWVLALAAVALVLWRVRRLGRLAREPLPVGVKAIETTLSRGRLYRRAGDRGRAAGALRAATRRRVAGLLRTGVEDGDTLVHLVAHHTGRDRDEVADLLAPDRTPADDRELVELAARLTALEKEVRRS